MLDVGLSRPESSILRDRFVAVAAADIAFRMNAIISGLLGLGGDFSTAALLPVSVFFVFALAFALVVLVDFGGIRVLTASALSWTETSFSSISTSVLELSVLKALVVLGVCGVVGVIGVRRVLAVTGVFGVTTLTSLAIDALLVLALVDLPGKCSL
jgi:hypothetical protein